MAATQVNWTKMEWQPVGVLLSEKMALLNMKGFGKTICGLSLVSFQSRKNNLCSGTYSYITGEKWLGERKDGLEQGKITIYW